MMLFRHIHARFFQLVFIAALALTLSNCGKQNSGQAADPFLKKISSTNWQIFYLKKPTDSFIAPLPQNWLLRLDPSFRFQTTLNGSSASGTYEWNPLDSTHASLVFHLQNWNFLPADSAHGHRLQEIMQGITKVEYLLPPFLLISPSAPGNPSAELFFSGQTGSIYLYR